MASNIVKTDHIEQQEDRHSSNLTKEDVKQTVVWVENNQKYSYLLDLLNKQNDMNPLTTLVYAKTRRGVDMLDEFLRNHHYPITSIHGNKQQSQREEAIQSFKTGRTQILLSTIVAMRGTDLINIQHIVNFDLSNDIYVYRECIGRVNRNTGQVTSFFNEDNWDIADDLRKFLNLSHQDVPKWLNDHNSLNL
ncbi:hypothetical protein I4U23_011062 [Adineta vaga]|nr:hypothetical protein I4U23_011062 [Adineta vaga]